MIKKIINDDCLNIMQNYKDNYFDLAIVDPPYGLNKRIVNKGSSMFNIGGEKISEWDTKPDKKYFDELFRVSKKQIIWGGNYFLDYLSSTDAFLIWDKINGTNDMASSELAWTNVSKNTQTFYLHHFSSGYDRKIHPTQKPTKLYSWLLENYAEPTDKILDTHLGSGSSAIACHYFGVKEFVGIEIDKEYYDMANKRIEQETKQIKLL
tara:strand:- start:150 stop:773 length:624 start_codon:yes stop_codon:yes gene_type:complete